jgi:ferredoxin--NADP+ reductase
MAYVITQSCCNDAACVTVCPVNCIHPTPDEPEYAAAEMLYIDPRSCIDCGACVDVCPVDAVTADFELGDAAGRFSEINAHYYRDPAHQGYPSTPYRDRRPKVEVTQPGPLRVAIVGSGPAACYAAEELLTRKDLDVEVNLFERLPVPGGLVRFGVAPDHLSTKGVTDQIAGTLKRAGLNVHLNVEVGRHVTHEELLAHHHAVLYAVGAPSERRLDVPGEDLAGSCSVTEFVAWYNGHPEFAERGFDLSGERAVIVGNGNVALDAARVLVGDINQLARTDIADHALDALAASRIREVVVLGRRGPAQAAFTTPELLGLAAAPGFDVVVDPAEARLDPLTTGTLDPHGVPALKAGILEELAARAHGRAGKRVKLRFLASPLEILGADRVRGLRVVRNELVEAGGGRLEARPSGETEVVECGLVLRSIGYRGDPVAGLPFDDARGTLPNDRGRVLDPATGAPVGGVYAVGWIKRGPSGGIGANKRCAQETVAALIDDFAGGRTTAPANGAESLRALIAERQPDALDFADWKAIDRHERRGGKEQRRPRVKLTSVSDMVRTAESARATM